VNKTLIFSDVHLKSAAHDRERQKEFVRFLRQFDPAEYTRVICLGDLFDFWFEYKHVIFSGYFDTLRHFADLRDAGVDLHLICGNHDFWGGRFLRDELNFKIHHEGVTLPFAAQRAYFVHGDGVNPNDTGYRIYKRFARNPFVVGAFRLIHPDWAMAIAQGVSHSSRTLLQNHDPANGPEAKALKAHAAKLLASGEADAVFCGHAHAPCRENYPAPTGEGLYINTGDWLQHKSYVTWDGAEFVLHGADAKP
jgi:UDP-2,3-diacylglucosamine hydrolase